ncbi:SusC/RagA family TonB-linked outer membrane protein [uncultured Hymenobacter sp.]|uniref:SusC/RagA family TonB-linked outer membrane protein n=1 Tax=uncultured Hymenobacter sp. TaxID=170016 RepID=UPI0035CBA683
MNRLHTPFSGPLARHATVAAGLLLLHTPAAGAYAQLLASAQTPQQQRQVAKRAVPLKELLGQWEKQYNTTIVYKTDLVRNKSAVPQNESGSLEEQLSSALQQVGLRYQKLRSDYYVIVETKPSGALPSKTTPIAGRVTMAGGAGLPGVTVVVKGTTTGTSTDGEGNFTLEVPEGATLAFSFVGYVSQEVTVGKQTALNITLQEDNKALDEVVVVGYGTQKAGNVTGAITGITAKEIEERPVNRIENALVGQMPGVEVQTPTGEPGADLQIRVRGAASITASNEPLYVVDGVPVDNLRGINPTDVANIEVLKDAASAAIYGSRGSNGVVLVTTKRGKKGAPKLQFSGFTGIQNVESKLDVQSAEEWIQMRKDGIDEEWVRQNTALNRPEDSREVRLQRLSRNGTVAVTPANVLRYTHDPKWAYGQDSLAYIDWQDALFRQAVMQQYTVGISGGTDKVNYNVNGSYLDQNGIVLGTNLKRATMRANFDAQVRKGIKLTLTLAPSMEWSSLGRVDGDDAQAANAAQMPPVAPKEAGIYVGAQPYGPYEYSGRYISPIAVMERSQVRGTRTRLNANMGLNFDIYKGLQLQLLGALDNGYFQDQQFFPTNTSRDWATAANEGALSRSRYYQSFNTRYLFQSVLNYTRSFGDHNLNAILGYSVERTRFDNSQQQNTQLPNDLTYLFDRSNSTTNQNNISSGQEALLSYFARLQYDYKQKYLLSASLRRDGSSKFGSGRPWGYFPAVSAGWRVSGEEFMAGVTALSDLKFRASWGVTGNNRIPNNSQFATLGVSNYSYGGAASTGYAPNNIENDLLGWEQTASFNYGLDFSLLSNRVQVSADYYVKKTSDLLYTVPIVSLSGFTTNFRNIGNVRNEGLELGVTTQNLIGAFTWRTTFNASYNQNEVQKLGTTDTPVPTGFQNNTSILQVGSPIGAFLLYEAIGVYQTQAEVDAGPRMSGTRVGDSKYKDQNGDDVIDNQDRALLGSPRPKYTFGMTNTFTFKSFDLSVFMNAQQGGYLYSILGRTIDRPGMGYNYNHAANWNNRWQSEANPGDGMTPSITATTGAYFDSRWLYKSDYLRVKNITLGYTLPKGKLYASARVYLALENAYIWHSYTGGFSPEAVQSGGYDSGSYPQARTYTIGFNLAL